METVGHIRAKVILTENQIAAQQLREKPPKAEGDTPQKVCWLNTVGGNPTILMYLQWLVTTGDESYITRINSVVSFLEPNFQTVE